MMCAGISCLGATIQGNSFFQGDPPGLNYSSVVLASARNKRHFLGSSAEPSSLLKPSSPFKNQPAAGESFLLLKIVSMSSHQPTNPLNRLRAVRDVFVPGDRFYSAGSAGPLNDGSSEHSVAADRSQAWRSSPTKSTALAPCSSVPPPLSRTGARRM